MALATARPAFSFHHLPALQPIIKPSKTHHLSIPFPLQSPIISSSLLYRVPHSMNVFKEDNPTEAAETTTEDKKLDRRRLEEQFVVLNTGVYDCRSCGYRYNEAVGDPSYPIPPGLGFQKLPDDWRCPTCGAAKSFFDSKSVEIAGFAQNQQFGIGGNTLTSGQKGFLIYGGLLLAFALFLSGYFLQ